MDVLVVCKNVCKNEEDPIKNEGARVVTTLFIDFSDAQGQLTLRMKFDYDRPAGLRDIHESVDAQTDGRRDAGSSPIL